ncbi:MAG: SAM-dependent methyltransferase, partial [Candidatus Entotheonellia bacterium]
MESLQGRQTPAAGPMAQLQYELALRQGLFAKVHGGLRYGVDHLRGLTRTIGARSTPTPLGPYVPTPPIVARRLLQLARVHSTDTVYDLGCGDGRMVIMAAQEFGARGVGLDIDPARIAVATANAATAGVEHVVQFRVEDVMRAKLDTATVVMVFLPEEAYAVLFPTLRTHLRPGTRVVSHGFFFPQCLPDKA